MPQSLNQKAVNNFIKGLITEAGEMTFPEGASTDELNCDLRRDGTRRRRLGVKLEDSHVLEPATQAALNGTKPLSSFTWKNVAGNPDIEYLAVHNGQFVIFYDQSAPPYSGKYLGFVDLADVDTSPAYTGMDKQANALSFSSINGLLIGTHATIGNSFTVSEEIAALVGSTDSSGSGTPAQVHIRVQNPAVGMSFIVTGTNASGVVITETITAGSGHNTPWTPATSNTFATVRTVELTGQSTPQGYVRVGIQSDEDSIFNATGGSPLGFLRLNGISTGVNGQKYFQIEKIDFKIRDFRYFTTNLTSLSKTTGSVTPVEVGDARIYDTLNSGWASKSTGRVVSNNDVSALYYFRANSSTLNKFPALTHPWFSGKNTSDQFDVDEWKKVDGGNSLSGNGHFVLDFFNNSSRAVEVADANSQLPTATLLSADLTDPINSRWRSCEAFSGRVFFAGLDDSEYGGSIVFSKLIDSREDIGACYQQNDPTSEHLSTLLPTDGGMITIPDADKIQRLYAYQSSIYVFAENGVWQISGVDGVFKADAYSVNRVSRVGILNAQSFVAADGAPFWWSRYGIHTLSTDPVSGQGAEQNISVTTIQSFWDSIDADAREKVIGKFDPINKRIYWGYPNKDASPEYKINNFLILDITLGAFYPWKIEDKTSQQYESFIVGFEFYSGFGSDELVRDVRNGTDGADDVVVGSDDVVSTAINYHNTGDPNIILLVSATANQIPSNRLTMGSFSGGDYKDWGETDYTSFAETGYDFVGDAVLKKNAPYLVTYCRVTETGFTGNPQAGYEAVNPSGLLVSSSFDFRETFSPSQQVYRKKYPVVVDPNNLDLYDYPEDVITSRVKLRGHGRSMRLRYESETGKDFILIGWGIVQGRNPRY